MKQHGLNGREYRVLAVAILFFGCGLFFFARDAAMPAPQAGPAAPAFNVAAPQGAGAAVSVFAKYPPPSAFQEFAYGAQGINGRPEMAVTTPCNDTYAAVIIYPAGFDYRQDPSRAVFNKAFTCEEGKDFNYILKASDIAAIPLGDYYIIKADEGTTGTWRNPR